MFFCKNVVSIVILFSTKVEMYRYARFFSLMKGERAVLLRVVV